VVLSVNDGIEIKANKKIVLHAGQSSIVLEDGNITFACPGNFTVKSGQHLFDGGKKNAVSLEKLPDSGLKFFDEAFVLKNRITGEPLANVNYRVRHPSGEYEYGTTNATGHTHLISTEVAAELIIEVEG
jgi:type VI secretion system secreted protein VgrG